MVRCADDGPAFHTGKVGGCLMALGRMLRNTLMWRVYNNQELLSETHDLCSGHASIAQRTIIQLCLSVPW